MDARLIRTVKALPGLELFSERNGKPLQVLDHRHDMI